MTEKQELVKVCIDYRMAKGQWETAENCLVTSITGEAYTEILAELMHNCWSMSMESKAGRQLTVMLGNLARLQGYDKVTGWNIQIENK